jgi:hypothetical protein
VTPPAGLSTGQAWYDWFLGVAPNNGNRIYVAGIEVYRGELSGTTWTWVNISNKGATGDSIHPDQHAIAFDPVTPDTIYVGCDGGLFQSPNRGTNWTSLNRGLAITEIEYLDHDIGSSRYLLAGTQDNGSIRYTGSAVWEHAADGDGGDCSVGTVVPTTVFHSFFGMGMERSTTKGNFGSWGWIGPNVPAKLQCALLSSAGDTRRVGRTGRAERLHLAQQRHGVDRNRPAGRMYGERDGDADTRPGARGVYERPHLPTDVVGRGVVSGGGTHDAAGGSVDQ